MRRLALLVSLTALSLWGTPALAVAAPPCSQVTPQYSTDFDKLVPTRVPDVASSFFPVEVAKAGLAINTDWVEGLDSNRFVYGSERIRWAADDPSTRLAHGYEAGASAHDSTGHWGLRFGLTDPTGRVTLAWLEDYTSADGTRAQCYQTASRRVLRSPHLPPPSPRVKVVRHSTEEYHGFRLALGVPCVLCRARFAVRWRGKLVKRKSWIGKPAEADMSWSCKRTGRHTYELVVSNTDGYTRRYTRRARGSFYVRRCTPWKPRFVGRGFAADYQSGGYPSQFVSSIRCKPGGRTRGGKAHTWFCVVTHNNNYRECRTRFKTYFQRRVRFGEVYTREHEVQRGLGCTYF